MSKPMTAKEYLEQESRNKPVTESCFANTRGITYTSGEIDNEDIYANDDMIAFAEAYANHRLEAIVEEAKKCQKGWALTVKDLETIIEHHKE